MSPFPAGSAGAGLGGYRLALQCNVTDLSPLDCQDRRTLLLYNAESWRERGVARSQGEPPPRGVGFSSATRKLLFKGKIINKSVLQEEAGCILFKRARCFYLTGIFAGAMEVPCSSVHGAL